MSETPLPETPLPETPLSEAQTATAARLPEAHWLDAALGWPSRQVDRYVQRVRRSHPQASPAELADVLAGRYRTAVMASGGAFAALSAGRGTGARAALGLTAGTVSTFLAGSGLYCLALAHVHGVPAGDLPQRRVLLQTALLGRRGPELLEQRLGLASPSWAGVLLTRVPTAQAKSVSRILRRRLRVSALGGSLLFSGALPYGAGAVLGAAAAGTMASRMIDTLAGAFGPLPEHFATPLPGTHRDARPA